MMDTDLSHLRPLPAMRGKTGKSKAEYYGHEFGVCYFCATVVWGPEVAQKYGEGGYDHPRQIDGQFVEAHQTCFYRWCHDGQPKMTVKNLYTRPRK